MKVILILFHSTIANCLYEKINENSWKSFCGKQVLRVCEGTGFEFIFLNQISDKGTIKTVSVKFHEIQASYGLYHIEPSR